MKRRCEITVQLYPPLNAFQVGHDEVQAELRAAWIYDCSA
jgi:hypothetical protein